MSFLAAGGDIEFEQDDVAVHHYVRLPLQPHQRALLQRRLCSGCMPGSNQSSGQSGVLALHGSAISPAGCTAKHACNGYNRERPACNTSCRNLPAAFTAASVPSSFSASKAMTSAQMNPRSKSVWIAPAACGSNKAGQLLLPTGSTISCRHNRLCGCLTAIPGRKLHGRLHITSHARSCCIALSRGQIAHWASQRRHTERHIWCSTCGALAPLRICQHLTSSSPAVKK